MKTRIIHFNTKGHDDFIDFIKAYSILCVLFGHTFGPILDYVAYGVWAGMQVPLFILIQSFHCLKKENVTFSFIRVFKRVLLPFFITEGMIFGVVIITGRYDFNNLISSMISGLGCGPGSYYPWIYLQIALMLIPFSWLLNKLDFKCSLVVFLIISEGLEVLFSFLSLPEEIYRLLSVRYVFLIFLGWLWVNRGVRINLLTIILSVISLFSIIYFEYFSVNEEPWFVNTGFKFHRWPCFFFVANAFTAFLYILWQRLWRSEIIRRCTKKIAASSYEIFLVQMLLVYLSSVRMFSFLTSSSFLCYVYYIIFIWTFSLLIGFYFHKITEYIYNRT